MIFKRIGTKKHKYLLEITLSSIKYCPWDSPCIKIILIRGDKHVQSPEYDLKKGRCNFNNYCLSTPCTMYFDDGKYLDKEAQIKIKAFNKQKNQMMQTLAKQKISLVKYTEEEKQYDQQLQFGAAKLVCSIQMKIIDTNALASDNDTQLSKQTHLSVKTEKIRKDKDRNSKSKQKGRNTFQFGRSNTQIKSDSQESNLTGFRNKHKKEAQQEEEEEQIEKQKQKNRQEQKNKNMKIKEKQSQYNYAFTSNKQKQSSEGSTNTKEKQNIKQKEKQKQKQKQRQKQKQLENYRQKHKSKTKQNSKNDSKNQYQQFDQMTAKNQPSQTFSKTNKSKSFAKQFLYQKQIQEKAKIIEALRQQNQHLKAILQSKIHSQPIKSKEQIGKMSRLQQQNEKLRQKLVEKQVQISENQVTIKSSREKQAITEIQSKNAKMQAKQLRQQLETVKSRIADMLTSALQSGSSQLIDFVQEHFTSQ